MKLTQHHHVNLTLPEPFDFAKTVAKPAGWHWSTPEEIFQAGVLWSGLYVQEKAIGLRVSASGNEVQIAVYSPSRLSRAELSSLRSVLWDGLGGEEDLIGFYHFAENDPILSTAIKDLYGMRAGTLDDVFGRTILAILLQMAPMSRSDTMMGDLLEHFGNHLEFDGRQVILWPRPCDIIAAGAENLKKRANLGYRAERLVRAAEYLDNHPLSLRELASLPEEEAIRQITEIYGVGEYSAGIILGRSSLPLDVWSVVIMSELFLDHTPEQPRKEIGEVAETLTRRWGVWKWFAFVYVVNDLENLARTHPLSRIH
jgi:3-methyladenine DNA glycosylase/8-oxoguanine DNA glycosylase